MIYTSNQWQEYDLDTMILDLNGTLQVWWIISNETILLIWKLKEVWWKVYVLTADIRWNAHELEKYWLIVQIIRNGSDKEAFIRTQDVSKCVAIWNARVDIPKCKLAAISIATIQWEWIHADLIQHVDILIPTIEDALHLFIDSSRFSATMKM